VTHDGTDAQGGDGRQFYRLKAAVAFEEMPVDFNEAPLVDDRWPDEAVAIPLLDEFG
jgi:hypothetical protein